jgi:membrane protein YdbS with pleckstrin-like domain
MKNIEFKPCLRYLVIGIFSLFIFSIILGIAVSKILSFEFGIHGFTGYLAGAVFGFLSIGYKLLYYLSLNYLITDQIISRSSGVLWKVKRSIPLDKITNIDVRQGPLERIMGYGKIWIYTPSTGSMAPEETILGIKDPYNFKLKIINKSNYSREIKAIDQGPQLESIDNISLILNKILKTLERIEKKME